MTRRAIVKIKIFLFAAFLIMPTSISAAGIPSVGIGAPTPTAAEEKKTPPTEVPQVHDVGYFDISDEDALRGMAALAKWDIGGAEDIASGLKKTDKWNSNDVLVFRSKLAFFRGDYKTCLDILNRLEKAGENVNHDKFKERVEILAGTMADIKEVESEHFIMRVTSGPDEIMIVDAIDAMEKAYAVLTRDLNVKPTSKVILEIYPTFESFETSTGLSKENVETSGTVAVCKFSRMIVTTPRALLTGYPWQETIAHEFVHYLIFLRSGYNCPIWLHEGIAKYQERRWKGEEGGWLSPTSQTLLALALKDNNLITFDEMDPSFAKLPSPAAGQIAFAEVDMCIKYLVKKGGFELVLKLLDRLKDNSDWRKAVEQELKMSPAALFANCKNFMKSEKLEIVDGISIVGVKIRKSDQESADEEPKIENEDTKSDYYKFKRLGELLQSEGREAAALIEYRKAVTLNPNNLYLLNKVSGLLIKQNEFDAALEYLNRAALLYPDMFPGTFKKLGIVYRAKQDYQKAAYYFEMSAEINPFDPEVQSGLWKMYSELGIEDKRLEAERKLAILVPTSDAAGLKK